MSGAEAGIFWEKYADALAHCIARSSAVMELNDYAR